MIRSTSYTAVDCMPLKDDNPCVLRFNNLESQANTGSFFSVSNISGVVEPGQILAVMGESGCGKTTFLNLLSGRLELKRGEVFLNGEKIEKHHHRTTVGYVLQEDIYFDSLTLKQTLTYTALLRLSDKFTKEYKLEKVSELITLLDLERCQNTVVGGLSGGEKKRLGISCELITNPKVLLIDEPTSGLDSVTAIQLINTLKNFATTKAKTIVMTVHQPSSQMFQLFDTLLLLCDGRTAYFGQASEVIPYFTSLGLPIPPHYNPAEFVLEKLKGEKARIFEAGEKNFSKHDDVYGNNNNVPKFALESTHKLDTKIHYAWPTSFSTQVKVLCHRNFRLAWPRIFSTVNVSQSLILAFMAGFVWFRTARKEETLSDLEGWMFFSTNYWMLFVLFQALWAFPGEKPVVEKERLSGSYRLSAYYFSKMIVESPLEIVLPSVYLAISYTLLGGTIASFIGLLIAQIISSLASQCTGLIFGIAFSGPTATTLAAVFTVAAQLLGGYLANNIPTYLKIFSLVYNGFRNMQIIEYHAGSPILCGQHSVFPSCYNNSTSEERYITPYELINREKESFAFPYWSHTAFLLACIVIFRALCYAVLRRGF